MLSAHRIDLSYLLKPTSNLTSGLGGWVKGEENIGTLITLLDIEDFYVRYTTIQLLTSLLKISPQVDTPPLPTRQILRVNCALEHKSSDGC